MASIAALYKKNTSSDLNTLIESALERFSTERTIGTNKKTYGNYFGLMAEWAYTLDSSIFSCQSEVDIILDGRILNFKELSNKYNLNSSNTAELLIQGYLNNCLEKILNESNGNFAAIIRDEQKGRTLVFNDKLGIRPLYIFNSVNELAVSTEQKSLPILIDASLSINTRSIETYLKYSQLIGTLSWWNEVSSLPAASIWTFYDNNLTKPTQQCYWSWSEFELGSITEINNSVLEELHYHFENAIESRIRHGIEHIIPLSGGLDSRLIVSLLRNKTSFKCLTFGEKGCLDLTIAKSVVKVLGPNVEHLTAIIDPQHWLNKRLEGVWLTDGLLPIHQLHLSPLLPLLGSLGQTCFSGYVGDLVAGGSWLKNPNLKVNEQTIEASYPGLSDVILNPNSSILNGPIDALYLDTRARRFTATGIYEPSKFLEQQTPFIDTNLLAFLYKCDDRLRYKGKLYKQYLLKFHKDLYQDIPWQKTGKPISSPLNFVDKGLNLFKKRVLKLNNEQKSMANPHNYIKTIDSRRLLNKLLFENDLSREYLPMFKSGKVDFDSLSSEEIFLNFTISVWLNLMLEDNSIQLESTTPYRFLAKNNRKLAI